MLITIQQNINVLNTEWTSLEDLWNNFPEETAHIIKDLCRHKMTLVFTTLIESFSVSKSFLVKSAERGKINCHEYTLQNIGLIFVVCVSFLFCFACLGFGVFLGFVVRFLFVLLFVFFSFLTWMTIGFDMSIVIDSGLWIRHKDTAADVLQSAGAAVTLSTSTVLHWL